MANQTKTKCSFCRYWTGCSCMATPNSHYCKEANDEYYQYLRNKNNNTVIPAQKSLRSWNKK